ncbi:MAG: HEPN domain-containing protein [Bacteroidia bacterium]|nr:HEPN domain-containing protein [Bacteroidia bacterium]MCF8427164.1 HEPN domain-containing protein [Bacteroidia bacterium]MCF8445809.1 HEPN domain-containing protein [Bacteroidia bacterium]
MSKRTFKNSDLLFHTAQGFYDVGYHVAFQNNTDKTIKSFQRLASSVVNFSFSLELFLKGLHLLTTGNEPKSHDLLELYNSLPLKYRNSIENIYSELKKNSKKELNNYTIIITPTQQVKRDEKESEIEDMGVVELLELHKISFINWRYLYEIKVEGYKYRFDFYLIDCFIKSLIIEINELKSNLRPTMLLNKVK